MCDAAGIDFVRRQLTEDDVGGRRVLEVGALDVNGSVRPYVESLHPSSYVGVDLEAGPGVDEVCDVHDLIERFGPSSFDVVICTEMLEHVLDWRAVVSTLKRVVAVDGLLVLTTRSAGFPYHGYPYDYWRYEVEDMRRIFAACTELTVERDPSAPGVFVRARRPGTAWETGYDDLALRSIMTGRRIHEHSPAVLTAFRLRRRALLTAKRVVPPPVKRHLRGLSRWAR